MEIQRQGEYTLYIHADNQLVQQVVIKMYKKDLFYHNSNPFIPRPVPCGLGEDFFMLVRY